MKNNRILEESSGIDELVVKECVLCSTICRILESKLKGLTNVHSAMLFVQLLTVQLKIVCQVHA